MNAYKYGPGGLALTKLFEGLKLTAYQDTVGVWTIGYGHTSKVQPGQVITLTEASAFLLTDVDEAVRFVNSHVKVAISQNEFDALVDFAFNLGCGSLYHSALLTKLNAEDHAGALAQFPFWVHAGGKVCPDLVRRRKAESSLFALV